MTARADGIPSEITATDTSHGGSSDIRDSSHLSRSSHRSSSHHSRRRGASLGGSSHQRKGPPHPPGIHAIMSDASKLPNLYGDWGQDSMKEMQVDPAIYDYDYDDISEAGSDFTEDYSRHKLNHDQGLGFEDDDDESSLSSGASFGDEDEDDWSAADSSQASSAVDSRKVYKQQQGYQADGIQGTLDTNNKFEDHLLEDPTEFSVEEDPLFNASGALKLFDLPPAVTTSLDEVEEEEAWSDENDPHESWTGPPTDRIWREADDGTFVPEMSEHSKASTVPIEAIMASNLLPQSGHSTAESSVDSFAGERSPPPTRERKKPAQERRITGPMEPLPQDPKLRIDDSDEDDFDGGDEIVDRNKAIFPREEVLVFSDDEEERNKAKKPTSRRSLNPIVPTSDMEIRRSQMELESILSQSAPPGHWDNIAITEDDLHYSVDFSKIRMSPYEHRAPLKDHSRRPRKNKSRSSPKKSSSTKKKKSSSAKSSKSGKESSRSLGSITPQPADDAESATSITAESLSSSDEDVGDEDASVVSGDSRDAVDGKKKSKSSKKAAKKKRKKDKIRKRGRRADYEEDSGEDDGPKAQGAVADRVEAIFTDKQKIFDTTLHGNDDKESPGKEARRPSSQMEVELNAFLSSDELPRHSESKPQKIRVKSKAAEATSGGERTRPSRSHSINEKFEGQGGSKSKSRSRSLSKDPSKVHRSRSRSKDNAATTSSKSRSRSKSVDKSGNKPRSRSKSVNRTKTESSVTPLKRRAKKDVKSPEDGINDAASVYTTQTAPIASTVSPKGSMLEMKLSMLENMEVPASDSMPDSATMISAPVPGQGSGEKLRKTPKRSKSMTKPKPEKPSKPKETKSSKNLRTSSKKLDVPKELKQPLETSNAMTLNDLIDDDSSVEVDAPQRSSDQGNTSDLNASMSSLGAEVPVDNTNMVRIVIQRLQNKITEIEHRTKDELMLLKKDFDKRKAAIDEKVQKEMATKNPVEAILCLHKIVVNDYHDSGRALKKELKSMERDMSEVLARSVELTKESIEYQRKMAEVLTTIQRLERENLRQLRALESCKAEHHELSKEFRNAHNYDTSVVIGDFDDHGLTTIKPLYQKYKDPTPPPIPKKVLMASYSLPKTSIFYNILNDNDHKLTFTK